MDADRITDSFMERMKKEFADEREEREKVWRREWKSGVVASLFVIAFIYGVIAGPRWLMVAAVVVLLIRADGEDWVARVNKRRGID